MAGGGTVIGTGRQRWLRIGVMAALAYAFVLILPHFVHSSAPLSRTFNSMLDHLLQGRFDVDPAVVGQEGFARDGRVYAYWGPLPALLRLPVVIWPGWRTVDFTVAYCVLALLIMAAVKLWTVRFVIRHHPGLPRWVAAAVTLTVALSGAQTSFLRFNLYQEVCLWSGLFGAVFVAAAMVARERGLGRAERLTMAAAAGAALLTRVSTGIGLIAAFALLLLADGYARRAAWRARMRLSLLPVGVLGLAILATLAVNYARWGHPLTFADYGRYILNHVYPDRLARTAEYGLFNLARVPFGLIYYFFPVWVLHDGSGALVLEAMRDRLVDSAELPPGSFLLTDPLLLLLGGLAVAGWWRRAAPDRRWSDAAVATGLAIPALLMLSAISMCHRYRIDFYPLIEFLAFVGLAGMRGWPGVRLSWSLATISIIGSALVASAYLVGRLGRGQLLIGDGIGAYYLDRFGLS